MMSRHQPVPLQALRALATFPLLEALFGRRSRRFGVGMRIPGGPFAYASRHPPQPLSETERLLLVAVGAGISGWNFGIPWTESGAPDAGCNYPTRPIGRTFPSGAATHGSELLINDDSGAWITRFRDLDADAIRMFEAAPDLPRLIAFLRPHIHRVHDRRVALPPEWPHVSAHNRWVANQPGTTLFVLLNLLWIVTGEGVPIGDPASGRLLGDAETMIAAGRLHSERTQPLPALEGKSVGSTTAELSIAAYNIHLVLQAMGLGGWLFSGLNATSLLGGFADQGVPGFGFRFARPAAGGVPIPLGLDGLFEPLVPPYVADMHEAVRRFAARKFGPGGIYDPQRPGPFREAEAIKGGIDRYDAAFVTYLGTLAQDILDRFGNFPATVPAVHLTPVTQAQHIDLDYYNRFFRPGAYLPTHANHQSTWHVDDAAETGRPLPDLR
jgi:hypothetical protein